MLLVFQDPKGIIHKFSNLKDSEKFDFEQLGFEIEEFTKLMNYQKKDVKPRKLILQYPFKKIKNVEFFDLSKSKDPSTDLEEPPRMLGKRMRPSSSKINKIEDKTSKKLFDSFYSKSKYHQRFSNGVVKQFAIPSISGKKNLKKKLVDKSVLKKRMEEFEESKNNFCEVCHERVGEDVKKFSKSDLDSLKEFNKWLTDIFLYCKTPRIVCILALKNLLRNYFSPMENFISEELKKIPIKEIRKVFSLQKQFSEILQIYKERDSHLSDEGLSEEEKYSDPMRASKMADKQMQEEYLKSTMDPRINELMDKVSALVGYLLKILMQREDPLKPDLDINKEMASDRNIDGFLGFKTQFLKTVFRFCLRITQILDKKPPRYNVEQRFKVFENMKKIDFEVRISIGGEIVKSMIGYLSSNGRIFKNGIDIVKDRFETARYCGYKLDISENFGFDSIIDMQGEAAKSTVSGSSQNFSFNFGANSFAGSVMSDIDMNIRQSSGFLFI